MPYSVAPLALALDTTTATLLLLVHLVGISFSSFAKRGALYTEANASSLEINQKKSLGLQECTRSPSHSSPTTGGQQPAHHVLLGLPRPALGRGPWHGPCQEQHLDLVRLSVV